jgi:outer membrane protein
MRLKIISLCLLLSPFLSFSQALLTLENAISIAVEKNYAIKIAQNNQTLGRINNTPGNAGKLPVVAGTALLNLSNNTINQTFFPIGTATRDPLVQSGVNNRNSNTGINAVWTVYDGMGMYATAARLQEIENQGKTNVEVAVETTVAQVCVAYYDVIRQKQQLKNLQNALEISATRRELAKANYEVGTTSKSDYLAAQVDYNGDQAALVAQEQNIQNAKVNLNSLLIRNMNEDFNTPDTIIFRRDMNIGSLRQALERQNPSLIAAAQSKAIAAITEKEIRAVRFPQVDLLGSYGFNTINNGAGFGVKAGRTSAFGAGVRLSVNIFDGFNQRRREQSAKVNTQIAELQEFDLKNDLQAALERTYNSYRNNLQLYTFEEQNLKIARQNVELAFERYKVGNSTAIEFREAQRNAVATEFRLIQAAYNVKITEIELLRLSSSIVEEAR